ncbi:MAG: hypothetical protein LBM75_03190 [Myxococcales bacterium]|jgi:diacylglycerol kinase family enzyme|nr:hypothetical protein [Myxococcales bacterium]
MYVQPIRPEQNLGQRPVVERAVPGRLALLLNANAKRVNDKLRHRLSHVVPDGDLYFTRTFEEARAVAQRVVDEGYTTVFTGGGDGTFVGFFNEIMNVIQRRRREGANPPVPQMGILKLGTGNALANLCNASGGDGVFDDILRTRAGECGATRRLYLVNAEGKRSPFAGVGLDAGVLNHYVETKAALAKGPFTNFFAGGAGYFTAITCRSVPTYLFGSNPVIEIKNRGMAYRLDDRGNVVDPPMAPGAILYRGLAIMATAGTIPFFGYKFRMFPYVDKRAGLMQLRVAALSVPEILGNLPRLWKGSYRSKGILDFLCDDIEIRADRKLPFQIGGDAEGYRDYVRLSVAQETVELVEFA